MLPIRSRNMKEALYYDRISESDIQCSLCPHLCSIGPSLHGQCGVRVNRNGRLVTMTYGHVSASEMIPIEKVPLYHYRPGAKVLLLGTLGCNMRCPFCCSWRISQAGTRTVFVSPEDLLRLAREKNASGVAFGMNEPVLNIEYIMDAAPLLHKAGLFIVLGTNGFVQSEPLFQLLSHVDALVVDVKACNDVFYEKACGGFRQEILNNIVSINVKIHLEISCLVIGGRNDDESELEKFFLWTSGLKPAAPPLHLLQYTPDFQSKDPATDPMRMYYLQEKARRILPFVYLSNMNEREANISYCPSCKTPLIIREAPGISLKNLDGKRCTRCGWEIPLH